MEEIGFYRLTEVQRIFPVCKSAWFAGIRKGIYPRPVKLGKTSLWKKADIHQLIKKVEQGGAPEALADNKQKEESDDK